MNKKIEIIYSDLTKEEKKKINKLLKKKKFPFRKSLKKEDEYIVEIRKPQKSILKQKERKKNTIIDLSLTDEEEFEDKGKEEPIRMKRAISRPIKIEKAIFKKKKNILIKSIIFSDEEDKFEKVYKLIKKNYSKNKKKKKIADFSSNYKSYKSFKSVSRSKKKNNRNYFVSKNISAKNLLKDSFYVGSLKLQNSSRMVSVLLNGSKFAAVNQFKKLFPKLDFEQILVSPKLLSRKILMVKIEILYNKVFEKILKSKKGYVNLSETIYELYCEKYKKNSSSFMQNIMNLLYSAEKYIKFDEIDIFLQIIKKKAPIGKVLLYIYIRQIFKFVTFNYFHSEIKIKNNPLDIYMTKNTCKNILNQGFGHVKEFKDYMIFKFNEKLKYKRNVSYYNLMVFLWKKEKFSSVK